jgi:putative glutamine amidotransferase
MTKPIIAIVLDHCQDSAELKYSPRPWYALRQDYSRLVARLGGLPILISYEHHLIDDVLALADGLLVPGGDLDIDPECYGQQIMFPNVKPNKPRSKYEVELVKRSIDQKIPFLGICFGMQSLNVALGGTLIQDIELQIPNNVGHSKKNNGGYSHHPIFIAKNTKLYNIADQKSEWQVNSHHHQAVDKLGAGLVVSAKTPDGLVEAIEVVDHPFALGVEWHPEYQESPIDEAIFKAFIDAAIVKRQTKRPY